METTTKEEQLKEKKNLYPDTYPEKAAPYAKEENHGRNASIEDLLEATEGSSEPEFEVREVTAFQVFDARTGMAVTKPIPSRKRAEECRDKVTSMFKDPAEMAMYMLHKLMSR